MTVPGISFPAQVNNIFTFKFWDITYIPILTWNLASVTVFLLGGCSYGNECHVLMFWFLFSVPVLSLVCYPTVFTCFCVSLCTPYYFNVSLRSLAMLFVLLSSKLIFIYLFILQEAWLMPVFRSIDYGLSLFCPSLMLIPNLHTCILPPTTHYNVIQSLNLRLVYICQKSFITRRTWNLHFKHLRLTHAYLHFRTLINHASWTVPTKSPLTAL